MTDDDPLPRRLYTQAEMDAAIAAEREACAKVCEEQDNPYGAIAGMHEALACADAIRKRST